MCRPRPAQTPPRVLWRRSRRSFLGGASASASAVGVWSVMCPW
ncbi:twin-arginine translocation signal domain-containing protein [Streptomyces sp. NBC_01304]